MTTTMAPKELIALCTQHIASYKKPTSVDIVDNLPKNFQGKILKRVLREQSWQDQGQRV